MDIEARITGLRDLMADGRIDAYVIPSSDPHQSEYPPDHWKAREWISGFDGSSGTVVVTRDSAGLWTDSRYYLAAEAAVNGTPIELHRSGSPDVLDYPEYLAGQLPAGSVVGFCGAVLSESAHRRLKGTLQKRGIATKATRDLIAEMWEDRPALPSEAVFEHSVEFTGLSRLGKLARVREEISENDCEWLVIATLDDVAWLFNLRGADVPYNPVFIAYAAVSTDRAILCVDAEKVRPEVATSLADDGVTVLEYSDVSEVVRSIPADARVLVDPDRISVDLYGQVGGQRVEEMNPTTRLKAQKSEVELANLRRCMVRDGAAVVRFLHWLSSTIAAGETPTEYECQVRLLEFRREGDRFVSESFNTISAYNANAPIVHYAAAADGSSRLTAKGLYLVDSGGQYLDGTTDITRTVALGTPTDEQKLDFTLVLKAHIALATTKFPVGTTGHELDSISRRPLWNRHANYGHGTGHGVGYFLNVHEGPQRISPRPNAIALEEGMIVSNEPGLYHTGRYGIRIENLVVVTGSEEGEFGSFRGFETLTLCPIDRNLVEVSVLSKEEHEWLNAYHQRVREALAGELPDDARGWLMDATEPV